MFWILMRRTLKDWKDALIFVKPDTVVRWHRLGFRYFWRRKSQSKPGRPPIGFDVIHLIKRMSRENPLWGAPRITDELALLGHKVAASTVAKYMIKVRPTKPSQTWKTFIHNHMELPMLVPRPVRDQALAGRRLHSFPVGATIASSSGVTYSLLWRESTLRIIPLASAQGSVRLWFGSRVQPQKVEIELTPQGGAPFVRRPEPQFREVAEGAGYWFARVEISGLQSDRRYSVRRQGSTGPVAATFRTLPERLTSGPGPSFTVLLGSCFSIVTGKDNVLGRAVRGLGPELFPHIKLLCGDQVYLDLPVIEDLPHDSTKLQKKLIAKYLANWNHDMDAKGDGFGAFLSQGANVFTADDHEFWNNYPARQAHLPITYGGKGKCNLQKSAKAAYRAFQVDYPKRGAPGVSTVQTVTIGVPGQAGSFEIKTIDGRFFRDNDEDLAHRKRDLDHVIAWLGNLKQPAALVLSQPLFDEPAGWFRRRFVDGWLANYDDYEPLARALAKAPYDVLLLSGDIHQARYAVAESRKPNRNTLHEIVASPLSRIPGKHGDGEAHSRFPDPGVRGVHRRDVDTRITGSFKKNHFATLSFSSLGSAVQVELVYWSFAKSSLTVVQRERSKKITLR